MIARAALLVVSFAATIPLFTMPVPQDQSDQLVSIRALSPQEYRAEGFVLAGPQTVRIEAVGAEPRPERRRFRGDDGNWIDDDERDTWPAAAWIIDARTREVVWDLRTAESERDRSGVRRFTGTVRLPAGSYLAQYGSYVATSTNYNGDFNASNIGAFLRGLRARNDRRISYRGPYVDDGSYREFQLIVRGEGRRASARELNDAARAGQASVIAMLRPDSGGATERYGFELDRATELEVAGVGELVRDNNFDYGWILNADTRRRVWTMDFRRSQDAGGAHKNRVVRETVRLPVGHYVAYYVTDDSHDPGEWNRVPPTDPEAWGLTLRVPDDAARARVRTWAYEPVPAAQVIVSMIGVRDEELRSEGFTLRRPLDVRIYALGEGSNVSDHTDDMMDDYAWIVDATSRRRVWTMGYDNTEHAGGAQKNRLFDGVVRLEAGSYLVYYKSDGSHAFGDWNDAAPPEARYWGISVMLPPAADRSALAPFERPRSNAIAELTRMRDGVHARRSFELDREQSVRVYAIGEGDGEMYDYGWIEDANGRTVWEMTYRMTTHAGGAQKNRLFDGTVRLPAGRYVLRWDADDSHSFGDWNSEPPDDPEGWGITILPTAAARP